MLKATYTFAAASGIKKEDVTSDGVPDKNNVIAVSGGCITGGNNVYVETRVRVVK